MAKSIDVLWTGGWDSTFRVLFASVVEKKEVRPHYIVDLDRKSSLREIIAISDVKKMLQRFDESAAERVKELTITTIAELTPQPEITKAYQRLRKQAFLGNQYEWLSRYARQKNIDGLELSVHVDDKAYYFLEGKVEQIDSGAWRLSKNIEGDVGMFSCFSFPLLEISKKEMRDTAEKFGFIEALEKSWFCCKPIGNEPCGTCNPCVYSIEEGMGYRLPGRAISRYNVRHIIKAIGLPLRASRKIYRAFRG